MADPIGERWFLSDCEGRLEIWREGALLKVTRNEHGEITGYQTPGHYQCTDLIAEWDLNTWDPGKNKDDDQRRAIAQAMVRDHNDRVTGVDIDELRGDIESAHRRADNAVRRRDVVRAQRDRLAERLAAHAFCEEHAAYVVDCPFCEDRRAYETYVAAGGRDYRRAVSGRPVRLYELTSADAQEGGGRG